MQLAHLKEHDTTFAKSGMRDVRSQRFQSAIDNLKRYKAEGELTATELKELKDQLNRGFEEAWDNLIREPFINAGRWESLPREVYDALDFSRMIHTTPGKLKALRKAPDHEATRTAIRLLEEIVPIAEDLKDLKGKVVKKKKAVRDKETAAEEKQRYMLGNDDVQRVRSALEQITENLKDDLYQNNLTWLRGIVKIWKDQYNPQNPKTLPREFYKNSGFRIMILQRVTSQVRGTRYELELDPNYDTHLQKEAKTISEQMIQSFVHKNTQKLAEILTKKNNLKTVELRGADTGRGTIEGTLKLTFKDGSSFVVHSSLVYSHSVKGTPFSRYPTTFHNVIFPDGTKMRGRASEQRMKDEFVSHGQK